MPVPVVKTATGRYLVLAGSAPDDGRTVAYCRVSSADQKPDLQRQAGRVAAGATAVGLTLSAVVSEVGSGLNARRPKLAKYWAIRASLPSLSSTATGWPVSEWST